MSVENETQTNEKQRVQLWTWWNSRVLVQDIWHEWSKNCLCLNKTIGKIIPKVCIFGLELLEFDRRMFPHGTEEGMQSCLIIQYICFMAFPPRGFGLLSLIHVLSAPSVCRNTALHRTSWLKAFHIISGPKKYSYELIGNQAGPLNTSHSITDLSLHITMTASTS